MTSPMRGVTEAVMNAEVQPTPAALIAHYVAVLRNDFKFKKEVSSTAPSRPPKLVTITCEASVKDDLTEQRVRYIKEVVVRLYTAADWMVLDDEAADRVRNEVKSEEPGEPVLLHWHITHLPASSLPEGAIRVLCGVVKNKDTGAKERDFTPEEYSKLRKSDMKEDRRRGPRRESNPVLIKTLLDATIKMDLMHVPPEHCVTLEFEPNVSSNRRAAFLLYNYARLANIRKKHQTQVTEGTYPRLPPLGEVSHLLPSLKDEQVLITHCLERYRCLLNKIQANLSTKLPYPSQLFRFMVEMCRTLSRYYRKVQVLTENSPHLLPVMHIRLHVLEAIQRVMENVFEFLAISPLSYM